MLKKNENPNAALAVKGLKYITNLYWHAMSAYIIWFSIYRHCDFLKKIVGGHRGFFRSRHIKNSSIFLYLFFVTGKPYRAATFFW